MTKGEQDEEVGRTTTSKRHKGLGLASSQVDADPREGVGGPGSLSCVLFSSTTLDGLESKAHMLPKMKLFRRRRAVS
jgi:hypothetical protein